MKALLTNIWNNYDKIILIVLFVALVIVVASKSFVANVDTTEEDNKIDTIKDNIQHSEKQIIKLDSLKNEYINKESTLSDSATINLFYWLLSR